MKRNLAQPRSRGKALVLLQHDDVTEFIGSSMGDLTLSEEQIGGKVRKGEKSRRGGKGNWN